MNDVEVSKGQGRALTAAEFFKLADIPPEIEWFANLRNLHTHAAYEHDLREFRRFVGIERPEEFRTITRAHVDCLAEGPRTAGPCPHHDSAQAGGGVLAVCLPL